MKTCLNCHNGRITQSIEGYAQKEKIPIKQITIRYCLVSMSFFNFIQLVTIMKNTFCKVRLSQKIEKLKARIKAVRSEYLVTDGLQVFFLLSVIEGLETELFSLTQKLSIAV